MKNFTRLLIAAAAVYSIAHADGFDINARLGKGVNLGNWGEAPAFDWGANIDSADIVRIKNAGFQTVRMPIRWETRADSVAPYTIDPDFFAIVDNVVRWTSANSLNLVINMHHHDAFFKNPVARKPQFLAMWGQISRHFQTASDSVLFEVMNEPHDSLTAVRWNTFFAEALDTIRLTNPTRAVVLGSAEWGGIGGMAKLQIPNDTNLIFTVHYYEPFAFTHQGADWVTPVPPTGITWTGSYLEKLDLANDVKYIKDWAAARNIPVWVGEFGAFSAADDASRHLWTEACARFFEAAGFAWSYWEFESGFGIWNPQSETWNDTLVSALTDTDTSILELNPTELGVNMVVNSDFSNGKTKWTLNAWGGKATSAVTNGVYSIDIDSLGEFEYGIQVLQKLPTLFATAKYALIFDAWSTGDRGINIAIQNQTDFNGYSFASMGLTANQSTHVMTFQMDATDSNVAVVFNLGGDTLPVFLDNIALVMMEPPTTAVRPILTHSNELSIRSVSGKCLDVFSPQAGASTIAFRSLNGRNLGTVRTALNVGHNTVSMPAYNGVMMVEVRSASMTARAMIQR